jgi:hypothetical protein
MVPASAPPIAELFPNFVSKSGTTGGPGVSQALLNQPLQPGYGFAMGGSTPLQVYGSTDTIQVVALLVTFITPVLLPCVLGVFFQELVHLVRTVEAEVVKLQCSKERPD